LLRLRTPNGALVETLIECDFKMHAINLKQMDRFRDRCTLAAAKDDSRDAEAMSARPRIGTGTREAAECLAKQQRAAHASATIGDLARSSPTSPNQGGSSWQ
jgi:hypothetical protein